jgi:hypothetical protein
MFRQFSELVTHSLCYRKIFPPFLLDLSHGTSTAILVMDSYFITPLKQKQNPVKFGRALILMTMYGRGEEEAFG